MNGEAGLSCPQCSAARDIYRYCMNCGFDYDTLAVGSESVGIFDVPEAVLVEDTAERPAVPVHPVLPPPADSEPNRLIGGRSAPVLLAMIAVAVFVLVLIIATIVSLIGSDDEPAETAASDSSAPDNSGDDEPAGSDEFEATCWDGTEVSDLSECSEPSGVEGLAWVFPTFDQDTCKQKSTEPAKWTCKVTTADGGTVKVRYREHKGVQGALAAYSSKYGTKNRTAVLSAREDVERYVWRSPRPNNNGVWTVSSMYAEHPWSVTVKGGKASDVEAAFNDSVEFRNPRRLSGSTP